MLLQSRFGTCAAVLLLHWLPSSTRIGFVMQPLIQFTSFFSILILASFHAYFCLISFFKSLLLQMKPPPAKTRYARPTHFHDTLLGRKIDHSSCELFKPISDEEFLRRCTNKSLNEIERALQPRTQGILRSADNVPPPNSKPKSIYLPECLRSVCCFHPLIKKSFVTSELLLLVCLFVLFYTRP